MLLTIRLFFFGYGEPAQVGPMDCPTLRSITFSVKNPPSKKGFIKYL